MEPHGAGGLGVLDPRLPSHPPGASFCVPAAAVFLPSRLVGEAAIAEIRRNCHAVDAFDAWTGALQPRQPTIKALIPE